MGSNRWLCRLSNGLRVLGILALLVLALLISPAIAQSNKASHVPVVLDGRTVFEVTDTDTFAAEYRAELATQQLQRVLAEVLTLNELQEDLIDGSSSFINIAEENGQQVLLADDEHLVTVTERDVSRGVSDQRQARRWKAQIEAALVQAIEERTPTYLRNNIIVSVGMFCLVLALSGLLGRWWHQTLCPFIQRWLNPDDSDDSESDTSHPKPHRMLDLWMNLFLLIIRSSLWISTFLFITNRFPQTRAWSYQAGNGIVAGFTTPIANLGGQEYSLSQIALLICLLIGLFLGSQSVADILRSRILAFTGVNRGAQATITILVRYGLIFFGTLALLQIWGVDISSLAILVSSLGIGIGFGLQDIAKNFGSGLVLVFERPIQVGDFVEVGEFQGTVEHIGARSTLIRTLDQVSIIVPNSRFLENEVINWSLGNPVSRIGIPVGVAYGSDIELVKRSLLDAATKHPGVLSVPAPKVFFNGFGDSALDFELMVWTADPSHQIILRSDLYYSIENLFRQNDVEIPFPQRDLHLRTGRLPVELSPQLEQSIQRVLDSSSSTGNGRSHSG